MKYFLLDSWKADYDGEDINADLKKLGKIHSRIQKKFGGKIDGPHFPQDASVLYIFYADKYEWLNQAGRLWFAEVAKAKLPFTPKEFFGQYTQS